MYIIYCLFRLDAEFLSCWIDDFKLYLVYNILIKVNTSCSEKLLVANFNPLETLPASSMIQTAKSKVDKYSSIQERPRPMDRAPQRLGACEGVRRRWEGSGREPSI